MSCRREQIVRSIVSKLVFKDHKAPDVEFRPAVKTVPVDAAQIDEAFEVETLEGTMQGKAKDYLMRGIEGELYICDREIFDKTYDWKKAAARRLRLANEVAQQYRQAGLFEAPPAMVEAIYDWAKAAVAAHEVARIEGQISRQREIAKDAQKNTREFKTLLQAAGREIRSAPGVRKEYAAYKALYQHGLYHTMARHAGIPYKKFSVARKEGKLQSWWDEHQKDLTERVDDYGQGWGEEIDKLKARIKKLKSEIQSGMKVEDSYSRDFDLDFRGWKYEAKFTKLYEDRLKKKIEHYESVMEKNPSMADYGRGLIEDVKAQWKSIRVNLVVTPSIAKTDGSWYRAKGMIELRLPDMYDYLGGLRISIRHELQHMAQDFMEEALGGDIFSPKQVGYPSRKIRTPEYNQGMGRGNGPNPERDKAVRRLQDQGVDRRYLRNFDFHSLDDIEFVTKLADSVDRFKAIQSRGMVGDVKAAIRVFTAQGSKQDMSDAGALIKPEKFFITLRQAAPAKWKEAVKQFVKAVL